MTATKWYTYYPAIKDANVDQFMQDGIKLVTELYGKPIIPINKVRLCYSVPLDPQSELRQYFQLCELVDEETGEFTIYLSHQPDAYSFHGQLGHEIAHLLNANMYDAYIEGLNTRFAEKLLTQSNLDWRGWVQYFQEGNDAFYAHTYHMMREIDEFLIDGELSNFLTFAEPIDEESSKQKINIEAWLETLAREKRDVVKFIIFSYAARIEVARRKSHSVYHFEIPRLCSCQENGATLSEAEKEVQAIGQSWNPERYVRHAGFVAKLGKPVVELLNPQPGERILDLGCGDGLLTKELVALGCNVVGVDASPGQIEAAKALGLDAHVMDGQALPFENEFDAVFSNAALHWMKKDVDGVIAGVWRALKPGGRFVAEFGGHGNVGQIRSALHEALKRRGIDPEPIDPWYFPTPAAYSKRLQAQGFRVIWMNLIPRPTPLPGDIAGWLETFTESFIFALPAEERADIIGEVREALRPSLCDAEGNWTADYVRLRFSAVRD